MDFQPAAFVVLDEAKAPELISVDLLPWPTDCSGLASRLARAVGSRFRALPAERQYELLEYRWELIAGPPTRRRGRKAGDASSATVAFVTRRSVQPSRPVAQDIGHIG